MENPITLCTNLHFFHMFWVHKYQPVYYHIYNFIVYTLSWPPENQWCKITRLQFMETSTSFVLSRSTQCEWKNYSPEGGSVQEMQHAILETPRASVCYETMNCFSTCSCFQFHESYHSIGFHRPGTVAYGGEVFGHAFLWPETNQPWPYVGKLGLPLFCRGISGQTRNPPSYKILDTPLL